MAEGCHVAGPQEFIKAEPPDSLRTPIRKKAMLACTYLASPFPWVRGLGAQGGLERLQALNSRLSSLEPALEEQVQAELVHSCLHSVLAVLPEPTVEDGRQEVADRALSSPLALGAAGRLLWVAGSQRNWWPLSFQSLYLDTMQALKDLLTSLLQRDMTSQGLQRMVEVCALLWGCHGDSHRDHVVLPASGGVAWEHVGSTLPAWAGVQMAMGLNWPGAGCLFLRHVVPDEATLRCPM